MIPISDKLVSMLNDQVAREIGNSILYSHFSSWAQVRGLKNLSAFFTKESEGELGHAGWLKELLKDANAQLAIPAVEKKDSNFSDCEQIAMMYVDAEAATTDFLEAICHEADSEYDIGVQNLMQKMLAEQTEEEGSADRFSKIVKIANGNLILLDLAVGD